MLEGEERWSVRYVNKNKNTFSRESNPLSSGEGFVATLTFKAAFAICFVQGSDYFALDETVAFGALGTEVSLITGSTIKVFVFAEKTTLCQRDFATFTIEALNVKIEIIDSENFSCTLFMTCCTIFFS